jgi:hypothetical protein
MYNLALDEISLSCIFYEFNIEIEKIFSNH